MADSDLTKSQTTSGSGTQPESTENSSPDASRRHFVERTLGGMALSAFFARLAEAAQSSGRDCAVQCFDDNPGKPGINCGLDLKNPPEIKRTSDAMLHAVLRVHAEDRSVPYWDTGRNRFDCQILKLRAYEGYQGHKLDPAKRVTTPGIAAPGPTFRAHVGDTVQIALLNHIRPNGDFPETADDSCDSAVNAVSGKEIYPGSDVFPNCFKASNTTNLHFHGMHVSPDCWGDNVLVQVRPNPNATPEMCEPIFKICKDSSCPTDWKHDDPKKYGVYQQFKTEAYNRLAVLQKNWKADLVAADKTLEEFGEWPEYWPGYYPNCFTLPEYKTGGKYEMGQSPGTHWYHAHRHGSTSIHMLNGLSGAFIVEGDYDKKLRETMPGVQEKVLVFQQFQTQPNRERGSGSEPQVNVNGQLHPVIRMKPNEVQWWRIVNATIEAKRINQFVFMGLAEYQKAVKDKKIPPPSQRGKAPAFRQTAQDGVQFAFENYQHPELQPPLQSKDNFALAPGNRVDLLVKAPDAPGNSVLVFGPRPSSDETDQTPRIVLHVIVESGASGYNTKWPEKEAEYPKLPDFLHDIFKWKNQPGDTKTLKFSMSGIGAAPLIDGQPFKEGEFNQTMQLGDAEQWLIINESPFMHPFHIHVNPFQLIEIFDPVTMLEPQKLPIPWIWWDTMPLPAAGYYKNDKSNPLKSGHVKIRHRFVDFPGNFVLHCHILAHEDRGMMQLVRVLDNKTHIKHH